MYRCQWFYAVAASHSLTHLCPHLLYVQVRSSFHLQTVILLQFLFNCVLLVNIPFYCRVCVWLSEWDCMWHVVVVVVVRFGLGSQQPPISSQLNILLVTLCLGSQQPPISSQLNILLVKLCLGSQQPPLSSQLNILLITLPVTSCLT